MFQFPKPNLKISHTQHKKDKKKIFCFMENEKLFICWVLGIGFMEKGVLESFVFFAICGRE
jgi:hypothetical protein